MPSPEQIEQLLSRLCVELGFCLEPQKENRIKSDPPSTIEEFTAAVFLAEGLDPSEVVPSLHRAVRELVRREITQNENGLT